MSLPLMDFLFPGIALSHIEITPTRLTMTGATVAPMASCPHCAQESASIHSTYRRSPRDLPISGRPVQLLLDVRRFRCRNAACAAVTFAERLPDFLPPAAQRTARFTTALQQLGLTVGGEAGARLAHHLAITTSPDTLLRVVHRLPLPAPSTPRVLGIDDWAFQKGRTYGTIFIDGETHQPIDLIPERTAEAVTTWLQAHLGVEVITRDRAPAYAQAATVGAPQATQVADRWHILKNLRELLERVLDQYRSQIRPLGVKPAPTPTIYDREIRRAHGDQTRHQRGQTQRDTRWQQVQALHQQGIAISQIARTLKISRQTVRRDRASPASAIFPKRPRQPSQLDPYAAYLQTRWDAGCQETAQLFDEIRAQGYPGSVRPLVQWTLLRREQQRGPVQHQTRRQTTIAEASAHAAIPPTRTLVWILLRAADKRSDEDQAWLAHLHTVAAIAVADGLAQRLLRIVRERDLTSFPTWLADAQASPIQAVVTFAAGLQREQAAIQAALRLPYSNGPTEGQITRLKHLRRTMYGRGSLDLLKRRFLLRC